MTLEQEIENLTWFNAPNKLKYILKKLKDLILSVPTINYFTPIQLDPYLGTRLNPLPTYNGFEINKSINQATGYRVINGDDIGNGAVSAFTAKGSGALFTNSTAMAHYGANYFIPYFAGNGAILSNKKLLVGTTAGNDLEFYTGTTQSNATPKLIVKNNGQIEIPVTPSINNTAQLLGRLSDGKVVTSEIAVNNNSTNKLTVVELNTQYPNVPIGFQVQNFYSGGQISIFFKSATGWLTQAFNQAT